MWQDGCTKGVASRLPKWRQRRRKVKLNSLPPQHPAHSSGWAAMPIPGADEADPPEPPQALQRRSRAPEPSGAHVGAKCSAQVTPKLDPSRLARPNLRPRTAKFDLSRLWDQVGPCSSPRIPHCHTPQLRKVTADLRNLHLIWARAVLVAERLEKWLNGQREAKMKDWMKKLNSWR